MSLDKELSGIARFNGDEFHIWKWQMKSLLQYKRINTIVNGEETLEDAEDKEDWLAREYSAFTLLCNSVERRVLTPLLQCTTSHQIWTTLLSIYEHKSSSDIHELQRRFFNAKIKPEQSLADYIGELQLLLSELTNIGDESFSEDSLISKITSTLPEGYDAFNFCPPGTVLRKMIAPLRIFKSDSTKKKPVLNDASPLKSFLTPLLTILKKPPLASLPPLLIIQLLTCGSQEVGVLLHKATLAPQAVDIIQLVLSIIPVFLPLLVVLLMVIAKPLITLLHTPPPILIVRKNFRLSKPALAAIVVAVWVIGGKSVQIETTVLSALVSQMLPLTNFHPICLP